MATKPFRVGLIQMRSGRSPRANLEAAAALIREAKSGGADYVQTPEMSNLMETDRARFLAALASEEDDFMLAGVRDSWVKRIDGRLDGNATDIRLDGKWSGMEFAARGKLEGRDAWMRGRLYLVDNRLYQLIVFGNRGTIPVADINRFMGSFKVAQPKDTTTLTIEASPEKGKK